MVDLYPSDLKTILHSKRANLYYLEHCRILVNGGRVEYVTEEGDKSLYWNIPIANTTSILLGTGTSITQAAMRELSKAGVLVGFCGGGGTPLFAASEVQVDVEWLLPQSEYRPTEYLQRWVSFWFDEQRRLDAAKAFQYTRLGLIRTHWLGQDVQREGFFLVSEDQLVPLLEETRKAIEQCETSADTLAREAKLTKAYSMISVQEAKMSFPRALKGKETISVRKYTNSATKEIWVSSDYSNVIYFTVGWTFAANHAEYRKEF